MFKTRKKIIVVPQITLIQVRVVIDLGEYDQEKVVTYYFCYNIIVYLVFCPTHARQRGIQSEFETKQEDA